MPGTQVNQRALAKAADAALRRHRLVPGLAELATAHVEMIPYAYPIPTLDRDEALALTIPWLEGQAIYPRGRFGTWRYEIGNMDHAVKMGIDIAAVWSREPLRSFSAARTRFPWGAAHDRHHDDVRRLRRARL